LKERAREIGAAVEFAALGDGWSVAPRPFGKYSVCLEHEIGQIGLTDSKSLPSLRVQPRAGFLHGVGPALALDRLDGLGERLVGGPVDWGLSRIDLFCDVQGFTLTGDDRHRFKTRASKRDLHEDGNEFNGLGFGRAGGTVSARIYDKTIESTAKGTDWWPKIWGDRYDPERPVLRVEFQIERKGLTEFGIDSPTEGLASTGGMWATLTEEWLSYRTPTGDGTESRWPVDPAWIVVQQASLRGGALGLERVRAGARTGSIRNLTPGLVGYCASVGALLDLDDLGPTMSAVRHLIENDEIRRGVPFADRIADRKARERLL
jgi:hypothetical protein